MTLTVVESPVRTTGRASLPLPGVLSERHLVSGEVEALTAREAGVKAPPLVRVTSRHRQLARLIAGGAGTTAAANATGLTASRVSILLADPTFRDLVAHAKTELDSAHTGFDKTLAGLGEDAAEALRDRFEEDPERFSNDELIRIVEKTADRTGFGPKRVEEKNVNVNFGDRLDAARRRAEAAALAPPLPASVVEEAVVVEMVEEVNGD